MVADAELWRARMFLPRFTPERWTMVLALGMYSACGQLGGRVLGVAWMHAIGRAWLAVALTAWIAVAAGEIPLLIQTAHPGPMVASALRKAATV
jgi:tellurite resistance protein TehA-like permease